MDLLFLTPLIFICLFILYLLARHDFVLLRQNISLAQIFDAGLISLIFAFFTSRVLYILNSGTFELFNILAFLHLIRYPGLSGLGFLIGAAISLIFLFKNKKGSRRIWDIFTIAFMPIFGFNLLLKGYPQELFYIPLSFLILTVILFVLFLKVHNKYLLRDGTITFLFISFIAANAFVSQLVDVNKWVLLFDFSLLQILGVIIMVSFFVLIFLNQKVFKS